MRHSPHLDWLIIAITRMAICQGAYNIKPPRNVCHEELNCRPLYKAIGGILIEVDSELEHCQATEDIDEDGNSVPCLKGHVILLLYRDGELIKLFNTTGQALFIGTACQPVGEVVPIVFSANPA